MNENVDDSNEKDGESNDFTENDNDDDDHNDKDSDSDTDNYVDDENVMTFSIAKTNVNNESSIESDEDDNNSNDHYDDINDRGEADVHDVDWNPHLYHLKCEFNLIFFNF